MSAPVTGSPGADPTSPHQPVENDSPISRCYSCNKWLSVFPIRYDPLRQAYLCGRCTHTANANAALHPVHIYEELAKRTKFLCCHAQAGCPATLKWSDVEAHEVHCAFQPAACPYNYANSSSSLACDWTGTLGGLEAHFREGHAQKFHEGNVKFGINCEISNTEVHTAVIDAGAFVIVAMYNDASDVLKHAVLCNSGPEAGSFQYDLQLRSPNDGDGTLGFNKNHVRFLCNYPEIISDQVDLPEIDLAWLQSAFRTRDVRCTFRISKKRLSEPGSEAQTSESRVLEHLECPLCKFLMFPPIYVCMEGHSLCADCNVSVDNCPICQAGMHDFRNYALEKLANCLNYPCRYKLYGCELMCPPNSMKKHERSCNHVNRCPLRGLVDCTADPGLGGSELVHHVRTEHDRVLFELDNTYSCNVSFSQLVTYHAAIYESRVFVLRLGHSVNGGPVAFNILQCGLDDRRTYRYRFEFVDKTEQGLELVASRNCTPQLSNGKLNAEDGLSVPLSMLEPFVADNKVYFKFQIQRT